MTIQPVDVRVGTQDLCLDCAAALGGKRHKLPKKRLGKACRSCVEMAADAQAETERYAEEQALSYGTVAP